MRLAENTRAVVNPLHFFALIIASLAGSRMFYIMLKLLQWLHFTEIQGKETQSRAVIARLL